MAKKTTVITVCDLHRGEVEATGSVTMVVSEVTYRLDLCAEHLREFTTAVRPWTRRAVSDAPAAPAARKPRRNNAKPASRSRRKAGPSNSELREWAGANGFEVAERGRVPNAVREAFDAAK